MAAARLLAFTLHLLGLGCWALPLSGAGNTAVAQQWHSRQGRPLLRGVTRTIALTEHRQEPAPNTTEAADAEIAALNARQAAGSAANAAQQQAIAEARQQGVTGGVLEIIGAAAAEEVYRQAEAAATRRAAAAAAAAAIAEARRQGADSAAIETAGASAAEEVIQQAEADATNLAAQAAAQKAIAEARQQGADSAAIEIAGANASEEVTEARKRERQAAARLIAREIAASNAPAPAPSPFGAPGPAPKLATPPCNWTRDAEGVVRPVNCIDKRLFVACGPGPDKFPTDDSCKPPPLEECSPLRMDPAKYKAHNYEDGEIAPHLTTLKITCADLSLAADKNYSIDTWGEDWYLGVRQVTTTCSNGTWLHVKQVPGLSIVRPVGLRCELRKRIDAIKDMIHYLKWSGPVVEKTEAMKFTWIDVNAAARKKSLKDAMSDAKEYWDQAQHTDELPEHRDVLDATKTMIKNRLNPNGEPRSQKTCEDMQKHFIWQLKDPKPLRTSHGTLGYANYIPPVNSTIGYPTAKDVSLEPAVPLTCSYTVHKVAAGFDSSRKMTYHWRDGCFCDSRWSGGCPFRLELTPSYKLFGFDAMEHRAVSSDVGAGTNALCWYWSKPETPEYGYLKHDVGYVFQAPEKNSTQLRREWNKLRKAER